MMSSSIAANAAHTCRGVVPPVAERYALVFPNNTNGTENDLDYTAIEFARPDLDGLPFWGPSGAGLTIIRRIKVTQQTGYYAQFWYTRDDTTFDGVTHGFHPYPPGGAGGTTHNWEIAINSSDYTTTRGGSALAVVKDQWFAQAYKALRNSSSSKVCTFYCDLPSTANANVIDTTDLGAFADSGPASPKLAIGDSPWFASFQNERFGGYLGEIKVIAKAMSEADIVSEAANMNQLVTADAIANIWWGKKGFTSVDDLTCDYGTGRAFAWANANKATLGSLT